MLTDKLDELMAKKDINRAILAKESGIPYTTIDGFYKKGCENIKLSTLRKLAEYFDITLDELLELEKKEPAEFDISELTEDEKIVMYLFQKVPQERRKLLLHQIETELKNQELL